MSAGELAGLIVAVAWAVLVLFLSYVLVKLGGALKELTRVVGEVGDSTVPVLTEVTATVATTNVTLSSVEQITDNVSSITRNAKALTAIATVGMGNPLIKAVSFTYGVRRAMGSKKQREVQKRVRDEMRREAHRKRRGKRRATKAAGKARRTATK
ncbi:DUF948 domain-containing protein [Sporichthya polymorpha]|uniref:DUF948 domain-containing protein n=1 Tax=Sporichthya polymorpha TaxID=35751 RepID=UPI00037256B0|nr:DUF948 domain-containing protein [Sporichthya polymorpha]